MLFLLLGVSQSNITKDVSSVGSWELLSLERPTAADGKTSSITRAETLMDEVMFESLVHVK